MRRRIAKARPGECYDATLRASCEDAVATLFDGLRIAPKEVGKATQTAMAELLHLRDGILASIFIRQRFIERLLAPFYGRRILFMMGALV